MEMDYEKKLAEMKSYIPFLDGMIDKLEESNQCSLNPRQAQLDKIRSLRDLLLNKSKRFLEIILLNLSNLLLFYSDNNAVSIELNCYIALYLLTELYKYFI